MLDKNFDLRLNRRAKHKKKRVILSKQEVNRIVRSGGTTRNQMILETFADCLLRNEELCNLKIENINWLT